MTTIIFIIHILHPYIIKFFSQSFARVVYHVFIATANPIKFNPVRLLLLKLSIKIRLVNIIPSAYSRRENPYIIKGITIFSGY